MEHMYNENYETLLKDISKDTDEWNDLYDSHIGRINITKMHMQPKAIYRLRTILIKIIMALTK